MNPLFIFQNYFSPYRHKLFVEIAKTVELTVVYMQKPNEEGRKWDESSVQSEMNYKTIQLENKRISAIRPFNQVVWVTGLKELQKQIPRNTKVIYLDNLPTNFTMLRIMRLLKSIPRKHRYLWNEHQLVKGSDSWLKDMYKKVMTYLLAVQVNTVISFSGMTTEYLKAIGLPMAGQTIVRAIQATYTSGDIARYSAVKDDTKHKLTFGFLGYFSKRKGIYEILEAIHYYKNPEATFLFVGDGPVKNDIAKAALRDSRIKLEPYAHNEEEKTKYFKQMDFNLVLSEKDPWCIVVNEAASRGVPSIVSPNVGAKELVGLIDKDFILRDNKAITLAKALTELEVKTEDKDAMEALRARTKKVAALWNIEHAATVFSEIAKTN